jgi:hypothetical protein
VQKAQSAGPLEYQAHQAAALEGRLQHRRPTMGHLLWAALAVVYQALLLVVV